MTDKTIKKIPFMGKKIEIDYDDESYASRQFAILNVLKRIWFELYHEIEGEKPNLKQDWKKFIKTQHKLNKWL